MGGVVLSLGDGGRSDRTPESDAETGRSAQIDAGPETRKRPTPRTDSSRARKLARRLADDGRQLGAARMPAARAAGQIDLPPAGGLRVDPRARADRRRGREAGRYRSRGAPQATRARGDRARRAPARGSARARRALRRRDRARRRAPGRDPRSLPHVSEPVRGSFCSDPERPEDEGGASRGGPRAARGALDRT